MQRTNPLLPLIVIFCVLGSNPLNARAEPVVFYCEVIPEKNETLVAVTEGTVNLRTELDNSAVPVRANTLRVIKAYDVLEEAPHMPNNIRGQIDVWKNVLKFGRSLQESLDDFFGASLWSGSRINLGDVAVGKIVEREITLPGKTITDDLFHDFYIEQEFNDRPGIFLGSKLKRNVQPDRAIAVLVTAEIAEYADVTDGELFKGKLILKKSDPKFNTRKYSMNVSFRASVSDASGAQISLTTRRLSYLGVALALAVVIGGALYLRSRTASEGKARVRGKLILTQDPTRGERNINVIDLQLAAHALEKQSIVFGNGPEADIQLPHRSVKPAHCRIFPVNEKGINKIYLTPLDGHPIQIDQRSFNMGAYLLQNGTQIAIGKFMFDFELTDVYRQVEVWTADGVIQRGVITYEWDVEAPGFNIVLFVDKFSPIQPPSFHFMFSEVKAIKFYSSGGGMHIRQLLSLPGRSGKRATVRFRDHTVLECRLHGSYQKKAKYTFALPPRGDKQVDYYMIVNRNVKKVEFL